MFNSKGKPETEINMTTGNTLIGSGTTITGDIVSKFDIRIDGIFKGNITGDSKVILGQDGSVDGDINCVQADIMGNVKGNIVVKELLNLRGKANVTGDIYALKLQIEPTVTFNGKCIMVETVSNVEQEITQEKSKKN
jgi:cytoskeletal protein CcmA (bactofilin family)